MSVELVRSLDITVPYYVVIEKSFLYPKRERGGNHPRFTTMIANLLSTGHWNSLSLLSRLHNGYYNFCTHSGTAFHILYYYYYNYQRMDETERHTLSVNEKH